MRHARAWISAACVLVLGACELVLDLERRVSDPTVRCVAGRCECLPGREDCSDKEGHLCEVELLIDSFNCGACGAVCNHGVCLGGSCECDKGEQASWDCNRDPVDGCEAVFASDPANCGACGIDCLGGACVDGQCTASEILSVRDVGGLAADGIFLYYIAQKTVARLALPREPGKALSDPEVLCQLTYEQTPLPPRTALVLGEDRLFWWVKGNIYACLLDKVNASARRFFTGRSRINSLAAGGGFLYFASTNLTNTQSLHRLPLAAGRPPAPPTGIDTMMADTRVFADGESVFWVNASGSLSRAPHGDDSSPHVILWRDMATDNKKIFDIWGLGGENVYLNMLPVNQVVSSSEGGPSREMWFGCQRCFSVVDDRYIYSTEPALAIVFKVRLSDSELSLVGTTDRFAAGQMAIERDAVYWATRRGIMRIAKGPDAR
jgi:hypothetical protein